MLRTSRDRRADVAGPMDEVQGGMAACQGEGRRFVPSERSLLPADTVLRDRRPVLPTLPADNCMLAKIYLFCRPFDVTVSTALRANSRAASTNMRSGSER